MLQWVDALSRRARPFRFNDETIGPPRCVDRKIRHVGTPAAVSPRQQTRVLATGVPAGGSAVLLVRVDGQTGNSGPFLVSRSTTIFGGSRGFAEFTKKRAEGLSLFAGVLAKKFTAIGRGF